MSEEEDAQHPTAEDPSDTVRPEREKAIRDIGESAARKRKAREEGDRGVWFGLGMFGLVGWAVAVPTVLGTALGLWLDAETVAGPGGRQTSWTLALLLAGVALGCVNAWYWVSRESGRD
ncbi:MAG: AtpZ/AtpI family protein [Pseudomonadota bacterium]